MMRFNCENLGYLHFRKHLSHVLHFMYAPRKFYFIKKSILYFLKTNSSIYISLNYWKLITPLDLNAMIFFSLTHRIFKSSLHLWRGWGWKKKIIVFACILGSCFLPILHPLRAQVPWTEMCKNHVARKWLELRDLFEWSRSWKWQ